MRNYTFLVPLRGIKIEEDLGEGIEILDGITITNGKLKKDDLISSAWGRWESNCVYRKEAENLINEADVLVFGVFSEIVNPDVRMNFLRKKVPVVHSFLDGLWLIRDNAVNGEISYLISSRDGLQYQLTERIWYTDSRGKGYNRITSFSCAEIEKAVKYSRWWRSKDQVYDKPQSAPKNDPLTLAVSFVRVARQTINLSVKTAFYCAVLEMLLLRGESGETTHKLSERVALLIGVSPEDKMEIFRKVKRAYSTRSGIVHGSSNNRNSMSVEEASPLFDDYLRRVFVRLYHDPLPVSSKPDEYFAQLLFGDARAK